MKRNFSKSKQNHHAGNKFGNDSNRTPYSRKNSEPKKAAVREGQCPVYHKCSGCQLQNMTYPEQLRWKQGKVERLLGQFGKISPILGMDTPYHYRNKVQAAFGMTRDRKVISGIYQSTTHRIVPVDRCMIEDEKADEIIVSIRKLMTDFKFQAYDPYSGKGFLRHVLVKRGFQTGQIMVVFVTVSPIFPAKRNFVNALLKLHPEITTVVMNVNTTDTGLLLGERQIVLYGPGYIEDILCGCVFRISARSFYQINPVQTELLYTKAMEFAELTGTQRVLDTYCGIGTIGLIAAQKAAQVVGVEVNQEAVRDAVVNAKLNHADNIRFYHADAGEFMEALAEEEEPVDVVFMDPPRAGSDQRFLKSVVTLSPKKVVYISCNPETQARDLKYLAAHGYSVKKIQPVDMFPHTNHVETVCLLSKLNAKQHIEINLDMDELDLTDAEKKATYQEIKD
ncbi:MAG: 23S rRNA (uracil(1939)-C(5))-methyltransferase RlmD, partial [Massiliimalia sp.]